MATEARSDPALLEAEAFVWERYIADVGAHGAPERHDDPAFRAHMLRDGTRRLQIEAVAAYIRSRSAPITPEPDPYPAGVLEGIHQAADAVRLAVRSLRPGDTFTAGAAYALEAVEGLLEPKEVAHGDHG